MPWYNLLLVVHFLGVVAVVGCLMFYARAGGRLRGSVSAAEMPAWITMLGWATRLVGGGAALLLASGLGLAALRWRAPAAFTTVGLVTIVVVGATMGAVGRGQLRPLRGAADAGDAALMRRVVEQRGPWIAIAACNGAVIGALFVMTLKPGWLPSIAIAGGAAVAGAAIMASPAGKRA
jgi:hypothetical protein